MFWQNSKTSEAHLRMGSGSRRFTLTWVDEKQRVALTSAANVSHASHVLCQIHGFPGYFPVVSTFSPNINANLLFSLATSVRVSRICSDSGRDNFRMFRECMTSSYAATCMYSAYRIPAANGICVFDLWH